MPVTVQLPGYNHAAPAVGLAQVIGAGFGAYKDYNQAQESQAKAAQDQAQTAGIQQATEQGKTDFATKQKLLQLGNSPDTPENQNPMVPNARAQALTKLSVIEQSGLVPSSPLFDALKDRINDPKQTPNGIQQIMEPLDKTFDPLIKAQLEGQGKLAAAKLTSGPREENVEFQKHKTAVDAVKSDPQTMGLQNGYQSIQNALVEFHNNPNVNSFHTLQNVIKTNAGSATAGSAGERMQQYADTTGMHADEIKQFLFGDPDMANVKLSDPKLVGAYMKVAEGELAQKRAQANAQIDKTAGSFASVYNKPSMKQYQQDFKNTVAAQKAQFNTQVSEPKNFDQDVLDYAKSHSITPDQAQSIKLQRTRPVAGK